MWSATRYDIVVGGEKTLRKGQSSFGGVDLPKILPGNPSSASIQKKVTPNSSHFQMRILLRTMVQVKLGAIYRSMVSTLQKISWIP